jgi:hypothetical protein
MFVNFNFMGEYLLEPIINNNLKIYVNNFPDNLKKNNNYKYIFIQIESSMIIDKFLIKIINNPELFDYILTWDKRVLKLNNAIKFLPLLKYSWIKFPKEAGINPYLKYHYNCNLNEEYNNKNFNISMLCSDKNWCPGHKVRHEIWNNQLEINIPRKFYKPCITKILKIFDDNIIISSKRDKTEMFDSMFHICIENNNAKDYFTEKIIDCIISKTVPVYYGCPNIGEYFDLNGIIIINKNNYIDIINNLTEETYYKMLPYIKKNYNTWLKMKSFENKFKQFLNHNLKS